MQQFDSITLKRHQIEKYDQYFDGDYFKVYKAKIVQTGELVALKEQSKITIQEKNLLGLQQFMKQQHIIEIKFFEVQNSKVFVIIENIKKSLQDFIFENEYKNKQQIEKCLLFLQIVQAIQEFHRFGIFHRNLKPINFVICENQNNQINIKLIDFGLVQFIKSEDLDKSLKIGSIEYLAPEILNDEYYDKSVDVWSLGVIWYQMLTGNVIFTSDQEIQTQQSIYQLIEQNGNQIDRNILNLLKQMLVIKSSERISLDLLISHIQKFSQNQININLMIQEQGIIDQLIDFKTKLKVKLEQQSKEELQLCLQKKQQYMNLDKIKIMQDEINQSIQNLLFQNSSIESQIISQGNEDFIQKQQQRDQEFENIQQQRHVIIEETIKNQEKNIKQRWDQKKNEISEEIKLQIKQQLLLDYNLQITIEENKLQQVQTYFSDLEALKQIIRQNNKKQLDMLNQDLDNSLIQTYNQQQYVELKNKLHLIEEQQNCLENYQEIVKQNQKFQKQFIYIKIDIDSIEKEIELSNLAQQQQRKRINLEKKSKNLFEDYQVIIDNLILKLSNYNNNYFNYRIQQLIKQKQELKQEFQFLFLNCQNQQIETLLLLIQKIQFFNEKLNQITKYLNLLILQLNSQQFTIQNQSNLSSQMEVHLNQLIDLFHFIQEYIENAEIKCTDINVIKKLQSNIKMQLETLNKQSEILMECQRKLLENNQVQEEYRQYFTQKGFYNSNFQIFSFRKYDEYTFRINEIINLKEVVKNRLKFYSENDFQQRIIDQWNQIKSKKEELENLFKTTVQSNSNLNISQQQQQIDKFKIQIIQIQLISKTMPSLLEIQQFNEQYEQNRISFIELYTLNVYLKQYYYLRNLNRFLSLKEKKLIKINQQFQNQAQIDKYQKLNLKIQQHIQEKQQIQIQMIEYQQCLNKQRYPFEIEKLNQDNNNIDELNYKLEIKVKEDIKVKLRAQLNDQNLINEIINNYNTLEFQPLIYLKQLSQWNN